MHLACKSSLGHIVSSCGVGADGVDLEFVTVSRDETVQGGFVIQGGFGEYTLIPVFGTVVPFFVPSFRFFYEAVQFWGFGERPPKPPF